MGLIHAEIEIVNSLDAALVHEGRLEKKAVRKVRVVSLVDSGAYMLCINETIASTLGLRAIDEIWAELADGSRQRFDVVGPVDIHFKNRSTSCRAAVLPGDSEVLLGSIPMEDLDVVLVPREQTIDVNPESPDMAKKPFKNVA